MIVAVFAARHDVAVTTTSIYEAAVEAVSRRVSTHTFTTDLHPSLKDSQCAHWHHSRAVKPRLVGLFHSIDLR